MLGLLDTPPPPPAAEAPSLGSDSLTVEGGVTVEGLSAPVSCGGTRGSSSRLRTNQETYALMFSTPVGVRDG